jgi:hypothetical protein
MAAGVQLMKYDEPNREPRDMSVPPRIAIDSAIAAANEGSCGKSRRGVSAYREAGYPYVVARGHNAPPPGFACDGSDACKAACAKVCIHAEQAVLDQEFFGPRFAEPVYLVHVKTVDGKLVAGGGPSCWQCSRAIRAAKNRVAGIWLYLEDGLRWRLYEPDEFHEQTLIACGLPVIRKPR